MQGLLRVLHALVHSQKVTVALLPFLIEPSGVGMQFRPIGLYVVGAILGCLIRFDRDAKLVIGSVVVAVRVQRQVVVISHVARVTVGCDFM